MLLATSAMNRHSMAAANIRIDGAPASQDSIIESPVTISDNLTKRILETWSIDKLDDLLGHDRSPPHYSEHLRKSLWSLCRKASLADAQNWLGEEVALRLGNPNKRGKRLDFLTDIDVKNVLKNKVKPFINCTLPPLAFFLLTCKAGADFWFRPALVFRDEGHT